jgi:hypothetical protein
MLEVEQRPARKSAFAVSNCLLHGVYRATRLKKIWLRVGPPAPYVKGLTIMVNSIANGARMEDVWLDK